MFDVIGFRGKNCCVYLDGGAKIFVSRFFLGFEPAGCASFFTVLTLMLWV